MPTRTYSYSSQSSTVLITSPSRCRRQTAHKRYLQRENLQELLERLFPSHPLLDFHIRQDEDMWSFDAPREVTQDELWEVFTQ